MKDNQFYPTGRSLAAKAYDKFKNKDVVRMLEPSAGRGDLLEPALSRNSHSLRNASIDCIEMDFDNQAVLREKGLRVVGHDFLSFHGAAMYSHILMNPPFNMGAQHVLHGWRLMHGGEIVAILNAETIRNPYTAERKSLASIIEKHGSVEFVKDSFMDPDTKRKTEVEVALVHLEKRSSLDLNVIEGLRVDGKEFDDDIDQGTELAVGRQAVKNMVINFDLAVEASRLFLVAKHRAAAYASRLNLSMAPKNEEELASVNTAIFGGQGHSRVIGVSASFYREMNEAYDDLRKGAWRVVLNSSDVLSKLSTNARKSIEAQFEDISNLEFTLSNIYGFIQGLSYKQAEIQDDMVCEVFDLISRYHDENSVFFQGWKSNSRHRQFSYRIMTTRFILPSSDRAHYGYSFSSKLSYQDVIWADDIDKVFAMLDSKQLGDIKSIAKTFNENYEALAAGERVSSEYFDMRFYKGRGSFHFFPRNKELIERLNRVVGRKRNWLPDQDHMASEEFWEQYEKSEKIAKRMQKCYTKNEMWSIRHGDASAQRHTDKLYAEHDAALKSIGIEYNPDRAIAAPKSVPAIESKQQPRATEPSPVARNDTKGEEQMGLFGVDPLAINSAVCRDSEGVAVLLRHAKMPGAALSRSNNGIFFTDSSHPGTQDAGENYGSAFLKMGNPHVVDFDGIAEADVPRVVAEAKQRGHDGLILRNLGDRMVSDGYVVFDKSQIVSANNDLEIDSPQPLAHEKGRESAALSM